MDSRRAGDTIGGIVAIALVLIVVGGLVLILAMPHDVVISPASTTRYGDVPETVERAGSAGIAIVGAVVAGFGALLLNVGLTAWAVSLGTRSAAGR